jgi:hypothetical protein
VPEPTVESPAFATNNLSPETAIVKGRWFSTEISVGFIVPRKSCIHQ